MATMTLTDTDVRLRNSVVKQLDWDPEVDASGIGVAAKEGVVTLTGGVPTYADKLAAERVAKTVRGVRGVANDLEVRLKVEFTDAEIAGEAVRALRLRHNVPPEVQVAVHDGRVTPVRVGALNSACLRRSGVTVSVAATKSTRPASSAGNS